MDNYKSIQSNKNIFDFLKRPKDNTIDDYQVDILCNAISFLLNDFQNQLFFEEEEEEEWHTNIVLNHIHDVYLVLSSNNPKVIQFALNNDIVNILCQLFICANSFNESYNFLKCLNSLTSLTSDTEILNVIMERFFSMNGDQISDEDEISYMVLLLNTLKILVNSFNEKNPEFFDENFFIHLGNFFQIDGEIDNSILLLIDSFYLTAIEIPDPLIKLTANIFGQSDIQSCFGCCSVLFSISKKVPNAFEESFIFDTFFKMFNYGIDLCRALLIQSIINLPPDLCHNYINMSIVGCVADCLNRLAGVNRFYESKVEGSLELASINFLNFVLSNMSEFAIQTFFSSTEESYDNFESIIGCLENALFAFKKELCKTFVLFINGLIKLSDQELYNQIVLKKKFPNQFSQCVSLIFELGDTEISDNLLNILFSFLSDAQTKSIDSLFIGVLESDGIFNQINDNTELDQNKVHVLINMFGQSINSKMND
ncbi:hypothetical protein TRFO_35396 [Tritrichomonas foetus]|uniref:Uncharacterized protein n=1 Tax=Tritrichomonas foetus TaxID=1144522 RepID=A0A1J4JGF7_9EUKA|nr:hypothetical protein TRFO_35396 [Tritrichomonas foetus]|eukprot:OHS98240.1 hypothetical protein TRFO_35396 [Tritrichomonas foetus]